MAYEIPKIPTAEEIAAMSDADKLAIQARLEAAMLNEAQTYETWENTRVLKQAAFDEAYSKFQDENRQLIDDLNEAKLEAQLAKDFMQGAAVARRLMTGEKTWEAFQAAEVLKPQYDPMGMLVWAINDAPGDVRYALIQLNTKATDKLILERADENGVPKAYEGARPLPALVTKTYTGKVLTKELVVLLAKPADEPAKMIEPVGEPVTIQVVDPIRLLTQDEVNAQLAKSETPTPIDPIPAVTEDEEDYLGASTLAKLRKAQLFTDEEEDESEKIPF